MAQPTVSEELLLLQEEDSEYTRNVLKITHERSDENVSRGSVKRRGSSSPSHARHSKRDKKKKKKRRRRSPSYTSSSSSNSSSRTSSSRSTVRSARDEDVVDRVHPKDLTDRSSIVNKKIPHILEFSSASTEIPDAPVLKTKEQRKRVQLRDNVLLQFEEAAKGRFVNKEERTSFETAVPLPNTLAALCPVVDEAIAGDKSVKGFMYESQLCSLQSSVLVALSALSLVVNDLPDASEGPSKARGYASAAMTVLGSVTHDLTTYRREFLLRSLRVDPSSVVPNIKTESVSLSASQAQNGERHPTLFGSELLDAIVKKHGNKNEVLSALNKMSSTGGRRESKGGDDRRSRSARSRSTKKTEETGHKARAKSSYKKTNPVEKKTSKRRPPISKS